MNKQQTYNIVLMVGMVVIISIVFIIRAWQLSIYQTVNQQNLSEYRSDDFKGSSITQARRGTIYDSKGQPIAMDTTSYSLYAIINDPDPTKKITDPDHAAAVLSQYLSYSRDELLEMLLDTQKNQIEFGVSGNNLTIDVKEAIEQEQIQGLYFTTKTTRLYVNSYYASHLIGYAQPLVQDEELMAKPDILKGQLGIEAAYNDILSGKEAYQNAQIEQNVIVGEDIYLTLDTRIQMKMEELFDQTQQLYQPQKLGGYVVEMSTGNLIAAAQRPTFNLNTREGIDSEWRNYLVEESFEPGSTIKILTMAVMKENDVFNSNETYTSGSIQVYDTIIHDHNNVGWGEITFDEGLARSSNTAVVTLVMRYGADRWIQALQQFGFGKTTDSHLPNEASGVFEFDNLVSQYMSSFGQAFSATPIQLLQAFSSIGNHGKMLKIQYIKEIDSENIDHNVIELAQPVSATSADYVLNLMIDTVEAPYGTAQSFKSNKVRVAAKTGTAEIANESGTGYLSGENDYLHSVVAFFPAENPQYMVYLFMQQPEKTNGLIGSQILAQIFHPLLESLLVKQ